MERLAREQEAYTLLQRHIIIGKANPYLHFDTKVKLYLESVLARQRDRVKDYPRWYKLRCRFPMVSSALGDPAEHMQFISDLSPQPKVPLACVVPPGTAVLQKTKRSTEWHASIPSVSCDWNSTTCADAVNAEVVMSDTALRCLITWAAARNEVSGWEIPVVVRPRAGNVTEKRVFVEDPLLARSINLREKNGMFYKDELIRQCIMCASQDTLDGSNQVCIY